MFNQEIKMKESKEFIYPFKVNSLYILESLNDKMENGFQEEKTGKLLFEDLTHYVKSNKSVISNLHYSNLRDKKEFHLLFQEIKRRIIEDSVFPLVHIEMHGNEEGIRLSPSNNYINWSELGSILRDINIACKNNLIVSLGVCKGDSIISTIDINRPAPFFAAIGAKSKVSAKEIYQTFYNLYSNLLAGNTFKKSLEKSIYINDEFRIFASELIFQAFEDLVLNDISSIKKKRKAKKRLQQFVIKQKLKTPNNFKNWLNKHYSKNNESFIISELIKTRNTFLLINKFPENKNRFPNFE